MEKIHNRYIQRRSLTREDKQRLSLYKPSSSEKTKNPSAALNRGKYATETDHRIYRSLADKTEVRWPEEATAERRGDTLHENHCLIRKICSRPDDGRTSTDGGEAKEGTQRENQGPTSICMWHLGEDLTKSGGERKRRNDEKQRLQQQERRSSIQQSSACFHEEREILDEA